MKTLKQLIAEANGMGLTISFGQIPDKTPGKFIWSAYLQDWESSISGQAAWYATPEEALDAALAEVRAK